MKSKEAPTLSYYPPEPVKPHTAIHIPGSHTLYIGPSSCMRRHALYAIEYHDSQNASCLYITETDLVVGHHEELISKAVEELIDTLEPAPHIFILAVFCVDDFLGNDENALMMKMQRRFPGRRFITEHIDPVTIDANLIMKKRVDLYSFLFPEKEHDTGVNIIGTFTSLDPQCDFLSFLNDLGVCKVREIFNCQTFEDYQDMAKSALTIGMRYVQQESIDYFTETLDIPYRYYPASYDPDFIADEYREIAALFGKEAAGADKAYEAACADIEETVRYLDGRPIAVDTSASLLVFFTADALLKNGFNVRYIIRSKKMSNFERPVMEHVMSAYPDVLIAYKDDYTNVLSDFEDKECIAIGIDAKALTKTFRFVDVWHDEGYYGFHGIHKLMQNLRDAADLREEA